MVTADAPRRRHSRPRPRDNHTRVFRAAGGTYVRNRAREKNGGGARPEITGRRIKKRLPGIIRSVAPREEAPENKSRFSPSIVRSPGAPRPLVVLLFLLPFLFLPTIASGA